MSHTSCQLSVLTVNCLLQDPLGRYGDCYPVEWLHEWGDSGGPAGSSGGPGRAQPLLPEGGGARGGPQGLGHAPTPPASALFLLCPPPQSSSLHHHRQPGCCSPIGSSAALPAVDWPGSGRVAEGGTKDVAAVLVKLCSYMCNHIHVHLNVCLFLTLRYIIYFFSNIVGLGYVMTKLGSFNLP